MSTSRKTSRMHKESPDGNELLVLELQNIHSAESQLARTLPRLSKAADSPKLRDCLDRRLSQGERLLKEIDSALDAMDESPGRRKNVAAEGLINDAREHVQEIERGAALDAVLIGALQKTEHYCIASWGTARSFGSSAQEKDIVRCMERALQEGRELDGALTKLAEETIHPRLFAGEAAQSGPEADSGEHARASAAGRTADARREGRVGH